MQNDLSPIFVPGDLDLDPSGRACGGKGCKDERNEPLYNDDAAPYMFSSELRGRTFGFDVNPDSNSFEDFRNSIAEAFYAQHGLRDRISFTFTLAENQLLGKEKS